MNYCGFREARLENVELAGIQIIAIAVISIGAVFLSVGYAGLVSYSLVHYEKVKSNATFEELQLVLLTYPYSTLFATIGLIMIIVGAVIAAYFFSKMLNNIRKGKL